MKNIKLLSYRHFFQLNKKSSQKVTEIRRKIQGEQLLANEAAVTSKDTTGLTTLNALLLLEIF